MWKVMWGEGVEWFMIGFGLVDEDVLIFYMYD